MDKKSNNYKLKRNIKEVFKELRQEGYSARMNYGKRISATKEFAKRRHSCGKKFLMGHIFYDKNEERNLWENDRLKLYYKAYNTKRNYSRTIFNLGKSQKELGEHIVNKFKGKDVKVEWSDDPKDSIILKTD